MVGFRTGMAGKGNDYLSRLKELVIRFFRDRKVKVVLFGSRARGDGSRRSDVDIGIVPQDPQSDLRLSVLREMIEEANIPYKVEVVNLAETPEAFRREVLKDAVVWKG